MQANADERLAMFWQPTYEVVEFPGGEVEWMMMDHKGEFACSVVITAEGLMLKYSSETFDAFGLNRKEDYLPLEIVEKALARFRGSEA